MPLQKIADFDSNYQALREMTLREWVSIQVNNEKIGTVSDIIVDDQGQFRYLAIDLGFWFLAKVFAASRSQIDHEAIGSMPLWQESKRRLYLSSNRPQNLDYDHEEQVSVSQSGCSRLYDRRYRICA